MASTPCPHRSDLPPDPFGYHGEMEDYNVEIVDAVGVPEMAWASGMNAIADNVTTTFQFALASEMAKFEQRSSTPTDDGCSPAPHSTWVKVSISLALPALPNHGAYSARLWLNGQPMTVRFVR